MSDPRRRGRTLVAGSVAAAGTLLAGTALRRYPPWGAQRWTRRNYRDRSVSLLSGPAAVIGLAAGAAVATDPRWIEQRADAPSRGAVVVGSVLGCGALGLLDDLVGSSAARGLRGHLRSARSGALTTGAVKVLGIGVIAAGAASTLVGVDRRWPVAVVTVAGSANLVNLFDLRPGRAAKVVAATALPLLAAQRSRPVAATVLGTVLAVAPEDLGERGMLGDAGANALGAALGICLVLALPARGLLLAATSIVMLTLVSEKISFSAVIADSLVLRRIDDWGRIDYPAHPAHPAHLNQPGHPAHDAAK